MYCNYADFLSKLSELVITKKLISSYNKYKLKGIRIGNLQGFP